MAKRHEFRVDVRAFVRAKTQKQAEDFAAKLNALIQAELGNFIKWGVSYTGSSVEVADLDDGVALTIVKKG